MSHQNMHRFLLHTPYYYFAFRRRYKATMRSFRNKQGNSLRSFALDSEKSSAKLIQVNLVSFL